MNHSLTLEEIEERIEKIKRWALEHGRLPYRKSKETSRREYHLYSQSLVFLSKSSKHYNQNFRDWCLQKEFLIRDYTWEDGNPRGFIRR